MVRRLRILSVCVCMCVCVAAQEHVRLTNLPHVYINTFSGKAITSKTTYVLARMWIVDEGDSVAFYDSLEIRGRGNSTWTMSKKPYRLKFHVKEKLLGKGYAKTKNWTLLANHGDKSLIRNALTSRLGERMGLKFNPAARFVDLTLNGQYMGNYQISDHIDVRPHRVDVCEQDVPLNEESNITGGYLLEADGFSDFENGRTGFYTAQKGAPIRIHYPDDEDIESAQFKYIRNYVNNLEARLFATYFTDSIKGYRALVDSTSLANWYLATEISGNPDGFYSTYFYKERDDDHIYWGPLWDYDIAYSNDNRIGDTSRRMMRDVGFGTNIIRPWMERMWKDPWFVTLISRRYKQVVKEGLEDYMLHEIDSLATLLDQSQQLNYRRWGINQRTLRECVLYSTYEEYIDDLRSYVKKHIAYLSEVLDKYSPDIPEPKIPDFDADELAYYTIANVGTNTVFDIASTDNGICANARNEESMSQQWRIRPLANGYMHITNRMTGLALNDPTQGEPTATTEVGTQLNTAVADSTDSRQQWDIVHQANERYNLINLFSQHGANLSGGNSANGTNIISYTNDGRNGSSNNRMWFITSVDKVELEVGIEDIPLFSNLNSSFFILHSSFSNLNSQSDYALAYDPQGQRLHFGAEDPSQLNFTVRVYDQSGRIVRTFRASNECFLTGLPHGIYIVSWSVEGQQRSVKFTK